MSDHIEIRWIQFGIVGGLCASVLYPLLLFAPVPVGMAVTFAALLGSAIGIGSLGLYRLLRLNGRSVSAALGAIHNLLAGALFTAMVLVQLAVKIETPGFSREIMGVWLGLDVAWDIYVGLGTIFFAYPMLGHPRFRWPFAVPGLGLGVLVIVLNLLPFPTPPAAAGSVDVGPFVGLWYLAATIQAWRSLPWARQQLGRPRERTG
jgi:hypothetical protein